MAKHYIMIVAYIFLWGKVKISQAVVVTIRTGFSEIVLIYQLVTEIQPTFALIVDTRHPALIVD